MVILVISCDKSYDLFKPFHIFMERHWKNHPEIIYSLETFHNPYYKTINKNYPLERCTRRVYETIKEINDEHILMISDDIFLREDVDNDRIIELCKYVKGNVAGLNLEPSFDPLDKYIGDGICVRNPLGLYKVSCLCQIWQKSAMLRLFNVDKNLWQFEKDNIGLGYTFLINKDSNLLSFGKKVNEWRWGLVKGKWTKEVKQYFDEQGIEMDYSIRGFCTKE